MLLFGLNMGYHLTETAANTFFRYVNNIIYLKLILNTKISINDLIITIIKIINKSNKNKKNV